MQAQEARSGANPLVRDPLSGVSEKYPPRTFLFYTVGYKGSRDTGRGAVYVSCLTGWRDDP